MLVTDETTVCGSVPCYEGQHITAGGQAINVEFEFACGGAHVVCVALIGCSGDSLVLWDDEGACTIRPYVLNSAGVGVGAGYVIVGVCSP